MGVAWKLHILSHLIWVEIVGQELKPIMKIKNKKYFLKKLYVAVKSLFLSLPHFH